MVRLNREQGLNIGIGTIASFVAVMSVVWVLVKPAITDAVAQELRSQIQKTVKDVVNDEVSPLGRAFAMSLRQDIRELRGDVTDLEFRKASAERTDSDVEWTVEDARELSRKRGQLEVATGMLEELEQ